MKISLLARWTAALVFCGVASLCLAILFQSTVSGTVRVAATTASVTVSDAHVQALQGNAVASSTKSGVDGYFAIGDLDPGSYTFEFSKANFVRTQITNVNVLANQNLTLEGLLIPSLKLADATTSGSSTRRWKIKNSHAFPVNYTWEITGGGPSGAGIATPGDSFFETTGIPEGQFLHLLVNGVLVRKKGHGPQDVAPETGVLMGTIIDNQSSPVFEAAVRLYDSSEVLVAAILSGAAGDYRFDNLAPGTYRVEASRASHMTISATTSVSAGSVTVQNLVLNQLAFGLVQIMLPDPTNGSAVLIYNDSPDAPVSLSCDPVSGECPFQDQRINAPLTIEITNGSGSTASCPHPGFTPGNNNVISCPN